MKKILTKLFVLLVCVTVALSMCSCARKTYDFTKEVSCNSPSYGGGYAAESGGYFDLANGGSAPTGLIMTYSADMDIESTDYDKAVQALLAALSDCGGYVSSRQTYGGYNSSNGDYVRRSLNITVKIPAENFERFLTAAADSGNVISLTSDAEDITSGYTDTKARLESLEAQRQRLMTLLENAADISDMLEIEGRLSDVIYQIESYSSTMKIYENLAAYSQVRIYLREVTTITAKRDTFLSRLGASFSESISDLLAGLEDIVILLVCALPYFAILGIVALIIVKSVKKKRAKAAQVNGNEQA